MVLHTLAFGEALVNNVECIPGDGNQPRDIRERRGPSRMHLIALDDIGKYVHFSRQAKARLQGSQLCIDLMIMRT